jgi:predicted AAA+ superfamily ATPase
MTDYLPRALGAPVREALSSLPVVVVTGLRQSGKSTFLQQEAGLRDRLYVNLDDFAQLETARRSPELLLTQDQPVTIDEVQKLPELLPAIKRAVDRDRRPGRFLLSGSANLALLQGITESLAGRALYLTLHPFTRRELARALDTPLFVRALFDQGKPSPGASSKPVSHADILLGGMPPVCLGLTPRAELWFKGYEQTYLERDVRELSRLTDLVAFRQLLKLAALRTGQVLNLSDLARDAKMPATTAQRYLSVLEASFLATRLPPLLSNRTSRLIKSPKLYLTDSGLAAYLADITEQDLDAHDRLRGALLETYVAQNLFANLEAHWPRARLHFWHIQGRYEVDFVIESGRGTLAIEIKAATRWEARDLKGLSAFLDGNPECRAGVLGYLGSETVPLGDRLWAVPLARLLS